MTVLGKYAKSISGNFYKFRITEDNKFEVLLANDWIEANQNSFEIVELALLDSTDKVDIKPKHSSETKCYVNIFFIDKNGNTQDVIVEHDGTEDCWTTVERDGITYEVNTYDTREFGDPTVGEIGCGVEMLTTKREGVWTKDGSEDIEVTKISIGRQI